ncbi:MAG: beta strand repeat-containing protein, partial [Flavobacterium sp.]
GAATATAFTTTYGTASTAQSFAVSGANLTANLVASAPTGFEVSNDGVTYGASASFTQTSGSASGTLTIRLAATAPVAGTYNSQNIVLSSTGATSVNISTPASGNSVSPKELTITGLVSQDKIYNGTTAVTVTGTLAYAGLVNGDTPTPPTVGTWTFSDANVGNNKILTRSVAYTNPTNYTVTQPSLTASITTKELTITGLTAQDKPFDGNTNVTVTGTPTYVGLENGESFTVTGTVNWAFPDATEGIDKVLVRTGSYNAPSANYTVNQPSLTASITAAGTPSLTVSEIASENTLNGDVVLLTLLNVEFADTNLSASNFTLNNAPAGLTVASVAHTSPTTANLTFAYDNTDFDANITNFTITIVGAELTPSANLTSAPITILAETETLNVAGTLAFGNQCTGQTSTAQSFTISGTNLKNANISLAAFTGYTYSETVDGTYTSTLSFAHAGGNLASKTIFVRFTPNALSAFNGNIVVTSLGAPNENQAVTGSGVNTPPTVTSPTSASITANAATLGGNITVVGCNTITTRGVEYSTTNGFENGTGTQVVENGSFSTGTFTANVTGLASSTTYYYKAFATSLSGTAYTTQGTFTTSLISTPVATAATAINSSGFTANWNAVAGATSYEIDVYTEGSYNLFSENFTNFNGSGFSPSPSDGQLDSDFWKITGLSDGDTTFGSSSITGDYAKGSSDIEVTSGGIYSFITVSNNNVLGIQPTGDDWTPGSIVLKLTNTSNSTLSSLSITYKIYVRNDQGRSSSFNFSHSSNDSVYTDVTALNYTSPTTADALGWIVVNRTIDLSGLSIPVNGSYFLRWSGNDVGGSSSRDEFGLDDVVVTSSVINNILQNQDVGNVTSYVVTGLDPETEYFYVVRAKEGTNSESLNSNEIT